jgi:hypothetical protein
MDEESVSQNVICFLPRPIARKIVSSHFVGPLGLFRSISSTPITLISKSSFFGVLENILRRSISEDDQLGVPILLPMQGEFPAS